MIAPHLSVVAAPSGEGPSAAEWEAARLRVDARGGRFAIVLFEDAAGEIMTEPVNVPSTVHQRGMYCDASPLFLGPSDAE